MPGQVPKTLKSSAEKKYGQKWSFEASPLMFWSREVGGYDRLTKMQWLSLSFLKNRR